MVEVNSETTSLLVMITLLTMCKALLMQHSIVKQERCDSDAGELEEARLALVQKSVKTSVFVVFRSLKAA